MANLSEASPAAESACPLRGLRVLYPGMQVTCTEPGTRNALQTHREAQIPVLLPETCPLTQCSPAFPEHNKTNKINRAAHQGLGVGPALQS